MDQSLLVENGHRLLDLLDSEGMSPAAALWFHDADIDAWRLWIVSGDDRIDKREFYRRVSEKLARASGIDLATSDIQLMPSTHPAIEALGATFRIEGKSSVFLSNNMLNGFFMPDGILLRMATASRSRAA